MTLSYLSPEDYKYLFPEMKNNVENKSYIYLSIIGFECSHEEISMNLELNPTQIRKKGQDLFSPSGNFIRTIEQNTWDYKMVSPDLDASDLIEKYVLEIIKPRFDKINRIASDSKIMLTLVEYYHTGYNPGYLIKPEIINFLSKINCSLQFDIYCLKEEEK